MLEILFILLFAAGINWMVTLHQIYQAPVSVQQKRVVIFLSVAIGIGLGYLAIL